MAYQNTPPRLWQNGTRSILEAERSIPAIEAEIERLEEHLDDRMSDYLIFGQTPSDKRHDARIDSRIHDLRRELEARQ